MNKKRDTGGLLFLDAPTVVELRRLLFEIAVIRDRRELFTNGGMPAPYYNALRDTHRLVNQAREIVDPEFKRAVEWNRAQERGVELIKAAQLAPLGPLDNHASYWRSLWRKIKSA